MRNVMVGMDRLLLTGIILAFLLIIPVAVYAGSIEERNSAGISSENSLIPQDNKEIIFNITSPLEDDVFYYDVVPAYLSVKGTISGSNNIRNVTVTYGDESAECGEKHDAYFDVSCNFLINDNSKNITINILDNQGLVTSETRNFSSHGGLPPPGWIYIYGKVIDSNGNPVHDAVLTFETDIKDYGLFSVNTTTDKNGKYSMKKTSGYQQKITIRKAGYQTLVQEVTFKDYYDELDFTLYPQKSSASGVSFTITAFAIMIIFMAVYIRREWKLK
jgi:hypothetical protein